RRGTAGAHRGGDVLDADDVRDGVLHLAGDLRLHLRGRHARVADVDDDEGEGNVRLVLDGEAREGVEPAQHQHHEGHQDRNGVPDRPGDEVHCTACALPIAAAPVSSPPALATATVSPSFRKPAPLTAMISPACTPEATSSMSPYTPACSTRRRSTTLSGPTTNT